MHESDDVQTDEALREIDREYLDVIAEALRLGRRREPPLPNPGDELMLTALRLGW